jgi:predicted DNA-binding protein with PD1-like motif
MNARRIVIRMLVVTAGILTSSKSLAVGVPEVSGAEYVSPTNPAATGQAPGLKSKLVSDVKGVKTYVLVFAKGDEVFSGLNDFATQHHVTSAHFTAIGALNGARVGWFDPERKAYRVIPVDGQLELASLIGNIATHDGKPVVHAHVTLGLPDGQLRGGHLLSAHVSPTVELYLTVEPTPVIKRQDPDTGLLLIDVDGRD